MGCSLEDLNDLIENWADLAYFISSYQLIVILFGAAVPLHQSIVNGGHHSECVCDDVDVCCRKKRIKWCRIGPSLSLEGQRGKRKRKGIKQC